MFGGGLALVVASVVLAPMIQASRYLSLPAAKWVIAPIAAPAKRAAPVDDFKKPVLTIKKNTELTLRSLAQDYQFTFTGTTRCTGEPCSGQVEMLIDPDGTEPAWISARSDASGHYSFQVPFKAFPHQKLDWTLTLRDATGRTTQSRGRQILLDDREQSYSQDLDVR